MTAESWLGRVRTAWDGRADRWDLAAERNRRAPDRGPDLDRTISALALAPAGRVLDAGCGTGQWAIDLALRGFHVTALDLSPAALALARRRAVAESAPPIDWLAADLAATGAASGTFDAVLCRAALHFVPDVPAALSEFRRVLRPGGRLLASVPGALSPIYGSSWERHLQQEPPELNWITPWELEALLPDAGWTLLGGWGDYGGNLDGDDNSFDAGALAGLDRRLQQAAATTWCVLAGRVDARTG